jgi:hypothetical protein
LAQDLHPHVSDWRDTHPHLSEGIQMIETSFIEIENHPVGMIVSERAGCRFYGASHIFDAIDGQYFSSIDAAQDAAELVVASTRGHVAPASARVAG